jgi:hypothetical protein
MKNSASSGMRFEQKVGHDLHVRADQGQQPGQDEALDAPEGVVGDHHHRAAGRDAGQVLVADLVGEVEGRHGGVDEGPAPNFLGMAA